MPTHRPLRPRSTTIGNRTCERPTVNRSNSALNVSPVNSGMITGAATTKNAVIAPSTIRIRKNSVEASRNASRLRSFSSSSVNTGTKAADTA